MAPVGGDLGFRYQEGNVSFRGTNGLIPMK